MTSLNNGLAQAESKVPISTSRFTAREGTAEKRAVTFFVADDKVDWLLDKAQHKPPSVALDLMKRAAPFMGRLQAERRQGDGLFIEAIVEAGRMNGLSIGDAFYATWGEIEPLMREAFAARAAELAEPHMAAARAEIQLMMERYCDTTKGDRRSDLLDEVAGCALDCARDTDLPLEEILDDLANFAGLTKQEIEKTPCTFEECKKAIEDDFEFVARMRENNGESPQSFDEYMAESLAAPNHLLISWRENRIREMEYGRREAERRRFCSEIEGRKAPRLLIDPFASEARRSRFEITMFEDLDEEPVKEWLVDDLLGAGEFSCFWGLPGCGKSVIVGDAAYHVAAGRPWHGKAVRKGLVVFVAAERAELTKRRFTALRKRHGGGNVPLAVIKGRLDPTSGVEDAKDIITAVRDLEERTGEACVWLVIDTIARTFGAGDENKQADMGAYIRACDLIRDELSAHVSVIHHCSRTGEKPRGSIALDGAVDATFKVSKAGAVHTVAIDKENDAPDGGAIRFRMEGVELGHDRRGKPTVAPVAVPDTDTVVAFEVGGVSVALGSAKGPRKTLAVLHQALDEAGEISPSGRRAVAVSELKRRLAEAFAGPTVKPTSLDSIVRRELKKLFDRSEAEKIGEWVFLPLKPETEPG